MNMGLHYMAVIIAMYKTVRAYFRPPWIMRLPL